MLDCTVTTVWFRKTGPERSETTAKERTWRIVILLSSLYVYLTSNGIQGVWSYRRNCDRTTAEMSETKTTDFIQQTLIKHLSKKIQLFLNTNEFCKYHRF